MPSCLPTTVRLLPGHLLPTQGGCGGCSQWEKNGRSWFRMDGKTSLLYHCTNLCLPSNAAWCQQWVRQCCFCPLGPETRINWHYPSPFQLFRLNPVSDIYGVLLEEKKIVVIISIKSTNTHLKFFIFKLLCEPFQEIVKNHDFVL